MNLNKNREDLEIEIKSMVDKLATTVDKSEIDLIAEHLHNKHGLKMMSVYSVFNNANNVNKMTDMIRLKDRGYFSIIINSKYSFLFNAETIQSIELSYVKNINELNTYLKLRFDNYEVFRKVD